MEEHATTSTPTIPVAVCQAGKELIVNNLWILASVTPVSMMEHVKISRYLTNVHVHKNTLDQTVKHSLMHAVETHVKTGLLATMAIRSLPVNVLLVGLDKDVKQT